MLRRSKQSTDPWLALRRGNIRGLYLSQLSLQRFHTFRQGDKFRVRLRFWLRFLFLWWNMRLHPPAPFRLIKRGPNPQKRPNNMKRKQADPTSSMNSISMGVVSFFSDQIRDVMTSWWFHKKSPEKQRSIPLTRNNLETYLLRLHANKSVKWQAAYYDSTDILNIIRVRHFRHQTKR